MFVNKFLLEIRLAFAGSDRFITAMVIAVLTLSLSLGALTAAFELNYLIGFRSLVYPDNQRLATVSHIRTYDGLSNRVGANSLPVSTLIYRQNQRQESKVFEKVSLASQDDVMVRLDGKLSSVAGSFITEEYLGLLAPEFELGGDFSSVPSVDHATEVVILSYRMWRDYYASNTEIIGTSINVNGVASKVIGVLSKRFIEPRLFNKRTDIWLRWSRNEFSDYELGNWFVTKSNVVTLVKRKLKSSIADEQEILDKRVNEIYLSKLATGKDRNTTSYHNVIRPLQFVLGDKNRRVAYVMMCAMAGLLLITCIHIANLLLARADRKQKIYKIQFALGARSRIVFRSMLIESGLIVTAALLLSLLVAAWGGKYIKSLGEDVFMRIDELSLSLAGICFALTVGVFITCFFSYLASNIFSVDYPGSKIRDFSHGFEDNVADQRRKILIFFQVFFGAFLLSGSLVFLQKSIEQIDVDLGINTDNLYLVELEVPTKVNSRIDKMKLRGEIKNAVVSNLDVLAGAFSYRSPLQSTMSMNFKEFDTDTLSYFPVNFVDSNYFSLLGIEFVQGRNFDFSEVLSSAEVAIVSESAARKLSENGLVLGRYVSNDGVVSRKIIGIVSDVYDSSRVLNRADQHIDVYLPHFPWNYDLILRSSLKSQALQGSVNSSLNQLGKNVYASRVSSLTASHDYVVRSHQLNALISSTIGITTLVLVILGTYSITFMCMMQRRYEFGIRLAVGARTKDIFKLAFLDHLDSLLIALPAGTAVSGLVILYFNSTIFQEDRLSYFPVVLSVVLLLVVSIAASNVAIRKILNETPLNSVNSGMT